MNETKSVLKCAKCGEEIDERYMIHLYGTLVVGDRELSCENSSQKETGKHYCYDCFERIIAEEKSKLAANLESEIQEKQELLSKFKSNTCKDIEIPEFIKDSHQKPTEELGEIIDGVFGKHSK